MNIYLDLKFKFNKNNLNNTIKKMNFDLIYFKFNNIIIKIKY